MDDLLQTKGSKPRKGVVLRCPQCGKDFYVARSVADQRKYCSRPCKNAAHVAQQQAECATCKRTFTKARSFHATYCCWKCYSASRVRDAKCEGCGKELKRSARRFCSLECRRKITSVGVSVPCEVCGKPVYVVPRLAGLKRYCSRPCKHKAMQIEGPGWKWQRPDGYVAVYYPAHPDTTKGGFMLEHRLVAEQKYGRRILRTEHVHHINGVKDDNRPENLEVISPGDHAKISTGQGNAKRRAMREELEEYRRRFGPLDSG